MNEDFLATHEQDAVVRVHFNHRCLLIADVDNAIALWSESVAQGFQASDSMHTGLRSIYSLAYPG